MKKKIKQGDQEDTETQKGNNNAEEDILPSQLSGDDIQEIIDYLSSSL